MSTTFPATVPASGRASDRPIVTKIVSKFQLTIPPEIRELYDLREGDLLEWNFDPARGELILIPKRAQLITPQLRRQIETVKTRRAKVKQVVPELSAVAVD